MKQAPDQLRTSRCWREAILRESGPGQRHAIDVVHLPLSRIGGHQLFFMDSTVFTCAVSCLWTCAGRYTALCWVAHLAFQLEMAIHLNAVLLLHGRDIERSSRTVQPHCMENAMVAMIHSFMRMWQSLKQFSDPSCTPIDASLHPVRSPGQPAGARIVKYLVHTCMRVCVHAQNVASWVTGFLSWT